MAEKVLFLDIDGVLQPFTQYRHDHILNGDMETVYEELQQRIGIDYRKYDIYDVAAVYYDWDKTAVAELKRVLDTTGAKIVLSSSWSDEDNTRMRDLFRIYELHEYFIDRTMVEDYSRDFAPYLKYLKLPEDMKYQSHSMEILFYLSGHPEIKQYVVVDDMSMRGLGDHFVETRRMLTPELADECIRVLETV